MRETERSSAEQARNEIVEAGLAPPGIPEKLRLYGGRESAAVARERGELLVEYGPAATGGRQEHRSSLPPYAGSIGLVLALVAATLMSGCDPAEQPGGSGDRGNPGVEVWDSAGVEVIENHSPEWPANRPWSIDPEPGIVVGGGAAPGRIPPVAGGSCGR